MVFFLLPETRRRSLEDMDLVFSQAKGPLDVVRVARKLSDSETLNNDATVVTSTGDARLETLKAEAARHIEV